MVFGFFTFFLSLQSEFQNNPPGPLESGIWPASRSNIKYRKMYAIVEIAGQQFKVEKGKRIFVHSLDIDEGSNVNFDRVLLIENNGKILIGEPHIKGAYIEGKILEHVKGDKVVVFKKKRRKGYKVKKGHRQQYSHIEIISVNDQGYDKKSAKAEAVTEEKPMATGKPAATEAKKPATKTTATKKTAAKKPASAKSASVKTGTETKKATGAKKPSATKTAAKEKPAAKKTTTAQKPAGAAKAGTAKPAEKKSTAAKKTTTAKKSTAAKKSGTSKPKPTSKGDADRKTDKK